MVDKKRILITGATGFLGRPLCASLQQRGWHVTALNRRLQSGPWDQQYAFDLNSPVVDPEVLTGIDAIIHLAGIAHDTGFAQTEYAQINVRGSLALALMSVGAEVKRFIYISSTRVVSVLNNLETTDYYAYSKYDAELGLRKISAEQNLPLTIVRPSLVYGAGLKGNLSSLLTAILHGWIPPLPETEGGVSMIATEDLISALITILENETTIRKTYSLDDGEVYNPRRIYRDTRNHLQKSIPDWSIPISVLATAAKLGDLADRHGLHLPLTTPRLKKLFANTASADTTLNQETGWQPNKKFADLLPEILLTGT